MRNVFVICLLAAGWVAVLSETQEKWFGIGMDLVLRPVNPPVPITSITWKHKGDIVAEWIKDQVPVEYLGDFTGRTSLDLRTGELKLSNTKKSDEGEFTVELNNQVQTVGFTAKEIKPVPEPQLVFRPLTCSSSSETCTLICEGKGGSGVTGSEPVQYFWKEGNGPWNQSEKEISIINNEKTRRVETFSCKMQNTISEKESTAEKNPFVFNSSNSGPNPAGVALGVLGIVVVSVLVALGVWKREYIKSLFQSSNENFHRDGDIETKTVESTPMNSPEEEPNGV